MAHPDTATGKLERTLTRAARARARVRDAMPEPQVLVIAPGFEFAFGDRARRFHTASVGKTMTATLAFQLAERGALDLDAPITGLLPAEEWRGLFVVDGIDRAREVTALHLLAHTSGVADYFEGPTRAPRSFVDDVISAPDRLWAPADLLGYTREHQRPVGAPGARFAYSDTGYVLAARIIEEAGGAPLHRQLHERIFAPVGMDQSCLLFHSWPGGGDAGGDASRPPAAALDLAPLWLGRHEVSRTRALSCDWGGGGVVSTVDDLVRFSVAWHGGELVSPESLARMTAASNRFRPGIRYGTGAMQLRYAGFSPFLRGMPHLTGHLGVTGAHLFGDDGSGIHLAFNFHATGEMVRSFRVHIDLVRAALRDAR
ncbi:serine hydrolase domain-containing protein [Microbacterium sp. 2FI]|uniref:serine hydrolase domain-containing protein n=1 Tax=Microbacterium sp. 2FI TaxID=2502193 RepID=UPI0014850775|nr:serine hydrolase domain-containing protein [Microbacterium sp. 2FI]